MALMPCRECGHEIRRVLVRLRGHFCQSEPHPRSDSASVKFRIPFDFGFVSEPKHAFLRLFVTCTGLTIC